MSNRNDKRNKKEEQKKMIVRIVCLVLVGALTLTTFISMLSVLFF